MNAYQEMISKHQSEFNDFPMFFAFNKQQFSDGMQKLGLDPSDMNSIYSFGAGGFYRKTDAPLLREMLVRHNQELVDAIAADRTGDGFIYDMFDYELSNHEYGYTQDLSDTLQALNLTPEEVNADPRYIHALTKAAREQTEFYEQTNADVPTENSVEQQIETPVQPTEVMMS